MASFRSFWSLLHAGARRTSAAIWPGFSGGICQAARHGTPKIRISRYEHSIAIEWDGDENWYRIEPDDMAYGEFGKRCRIGPGEDRFGPDAEWVDPFADPRPDIRRWTEPLRQALTMLDYAERHPWAG
ncbi:hypothetical protein [Streptosporangium roseum]|uniref:hypothetical protein n=1 Tax=Streptosporangium roseum TaxID=2001 RepID=UPI00332E86FD